MPDPDWESLLQFVSEQTLDFDFSSVSAQPVAELNDRGSCDREGLGAQFPTPPESSVGSPSSEALDGGTIVSVSTTFFPGANNYTSPPDLILLSSDSIFFYVQTHVLLDASENGFNGMLPAPPPSDKNQLGPVISVPESSAVLNIILHVIYDMSCAHYSPSFDALSSAVGALSTYGVSLNTRIAPSAPLYNILLSHAPLHPLELYALAASYDLYSLAVATSSHLLSFPLSSLEDDVVEKMGPVYLKRLFFLQFGRLDALRRLLLSPPHPHAPTLACDFAEQKKLTRAWALAAAYLAWDARPDLSTGAMESALRPLGEHLSCDLCQNALKERIKDLIVQWSVVKRTI